MWFHFSSKCLLIAARRNKFIECACNTVDAFKRIINNIIFKYFELHSKLFCHKFFFRLCRQSAVFFFLSVHSSVVIVKCWLQWSSFIHSRTRMWAIYVIAMRTHVEIFTVNLHKSLGFSSIFILFFVLQQNRTERKRMAEKMTPS